MDYGVDRYARPAKPNKAKELQQQKERELYVQQQANELWTTLPKKKETAPEAQKTNFPSEPQENIMYFIEKHSPKLESWQREIVRIVRKVSQYFYPQRQTKVMNEGWASFVHYYILNRLWELGKISDGSYLEFIHSHSGVLTQLPYNHKYYNGYNPYALGFDMFNEIRRICTQPTLEDEEYFPHLCSSNWLDACHDAVCNYRDESFISQFLSPNLIRKWGLFEIDDKEKSDHVLVNNIHDHRGYGAIRESLSRSYSIGSYQADIQIVDANLKGNRELKLKYTSVNQEKFHESHKQVLEHIKYLWGYDVTLTT
jgi:spore cortex formation protein SpoVR/YcgB (stage V sporulation)